MVRPTGGAVNGASRHRERWLGTVERATAACSTWAMTDATVAPASAVAPARVGREPAAVVARRALPPQLHRSLRVACVAAADALERARARLNPTELLETVADGADGTPTSRLDRLVEDAILEALQPLRVNVLSEECGFIDNGSALTVALDPVDGTGNATAGVPIAAFTAAIAIDDALTEAVTYWFDTGWCTSAGHDGAAPGRTTGRTQLDGALVSMIRPKGDGRGFAAIAGRAARCRIFGCSSLEGAWVTTGSLDLFLDAGSDTHRFVDLAAAVVLAEAAGATVHDVYERPVRFDVDLTRRWSGIVAASEELAHCAAAAVRDSQR